MERWQAPDTNTFPRRLIAADWDRLTGWERDQAIEVVRREGERAARWYLAEAADGSREAVDLRESRWALTHASLDEIDAATFMLYASAHTLPGEDDYLTFVLETHSPERADAWEGTPAAERREEPRVAAFCDGYERERCRILGLVEPPAAITDLQLYLDAAREREREQGRVWLVRTAEIPLSEQEETEQFVIRWEYERCMLATDLAEMLLAAALHRARLQRTGSRPGAR